MSQLLPNVTFLVYFRILTSKQHFLLLVSAYWTKSLLFVKIRTRNSRDPTQGNCQRLKSNYNVTLVITIKNTQYNTSLYILYINTEVITSAKSPKNCIGRHIKSFHHFRDFFAFANDLK